MCVKYAVSVWIRSARLVREFTWRRTCLVSANCRHGCTAASSQEELHRLAFYGRRETKPHQAGFQRALRSQRNMAKWLKTTFPTHRVKTAPFFDLRRGIAIKWGALGRLSSRDNSVKISMCQRWVNCPSFALAWLIMFSPSSCPSRRSLPSPRSPLRLPLTYAAP